MKNKIRDVLADKKVKLQELTAQAEAAVDPVMRTISGLELVNQETDGMIAEIDEYSTEFACTRVELGKNRTRNATIITSFARLLEVPETESQPVA